MGRPVAFITGSSQGIGAGIALEMAKAGYDIAINYNTSKEKALEVKAKVEAEGAKTAVIGGNISKLDDIDRMFEEFFAVFSHVNVMVNNAGITRFAPFLETTPDMFEILTNTDWRGSYFCAQKAARSMVENGIKGTIINITSNHQDGCWPQASVYGPTKAALNKFTHNAALELAPYGIRMVSIAPGYTRNRDGSPGRPDWTGRIAHRLPLGRVCEPWEVGRACVFLAGEGAGYITGTCIYMDGGALLPVVAENTFFSWDK
ncbi:MAG: SDR family oxidoreductase [Oscillospiraceae bacterium]|nr:SDR family oxidoreductase [Oscillospiraceae bacterium]